MVDMITPNFSKSEMACRCGCGIYEMDDDFMRMLQELPSIHGFGLWAGCARRAEPAYWRLLNAAGDWCICNRNRRTPMDSS